MRRNCALSCILLLAFFAVAAVSPACIGIYRVVSHAINQRAREFCIRTALRAQPRDITRPVLRSGIQLSILGIVVGLFMALALSRLIVSLLYEVKTYDPLVFLGSVFLLTIVAVLSIYISLPIEQPEPIPWRRCDTSETENRIQKTVYRRNYK